VLWLATSGPAIIAFAIALALGAQPLIAIIVAAVAGAGGGFVVGIVEGISEIQPSANAPQFEGGRTVGEFKQWDFSTTLLTDLESSGDTEYVHSLVVHHSTIEGVALIVTSEVNQDSAAARFGSHRLKLFNGEEPKLVATGDEWADIDEFRERSLKLAAKELELTGTWNRTSLNPTIDLPE
jgi:hypothetical protein